MISTLKISTLKALNGLDHRCDSCLETSQLNLVHRDYVYLFLRQRHAGSSKERSSTSRPHRRCCSRVSGITLRACAYHRGWRLFDDFVSESISESSSAVTVVEKACLFRRGASMLQEFLGTTDKMSRTGAARFADSEMLFQVFAKVHALVLKLATATTT